MYRLRHLNAAEADQAGRIRSLRHPRQNRACHLRAGWVRVQFRVRPVVLEMFRHRVAGGDLRLSGLALLRQRAGLDMSAGAENNGHRRESVSLSRRRLPAGRLVKRAAHNREGRGHTVNPAGNHEVERLSHRSADRRSRKAEEKSRLKKRRRRGPNN
jgi:hypothetical protein